jgi:hypothetical protein
MLYQHPTLTDYAADRRGNVYKFNGDKWIVCNGNTSNGYSYIHINGIGRKKAVHHIVYECFSYTTPTYSTMTSDGLVINHINEIKTDNRIDNIELTTNRRNTQLALPNRPKPTTCIDRVFRDLNTGTVYVAPVRVLDARYGGPFINATYSPNKRRRNIQYICKVSEL